MPERPFVYVCSPFRGDVEENTRRALEYSRRVFEAGYCPLAPHLLFPRFLDDTDPAQRQAGIEMGLALLAQCRQLVVCGSDVPEGMALEIDEARRLGIGICPLDELPAAKLHPAPAGKTSLRKKLVRAQPESTPCRDSCLGQERDV
ncbi:DUF4406 domain-containing protein [Ruminococcaceae bacterium OttesenSCG-928-A11]|nr:DUF4406 domain-containing protein [Ruminococcaceae bacterium OttesenSCG-928-A11]